MAALTSALRVLLPSHLVTLERRSAGVTTEMAAGASGRDLYSLYIS